MLMDVIAWAPAALEAGASRLPGAARRAGGESGGPAEGGPAEFPLEGPDAEAPLAIVEAPGERRASKACGDRPDIGDRHVQRDLEFRSRSCPHRGY